MKKLFAMLLAAVMLMSCSASALAYEWITDYDESLYDWKTDTTPVTLSLFEDYPNTTVDDENSLGMKRLSENTGVTLERLFPVAYDGTQIMLMLASNSLPDIIVMENSADWLDSFVQQAIASDQIWAMDDLIEQYAPNFKSLVAPEYFENFQESDGKTYRITNAINTAQAAKAKSTYGVVGGSSCTLVRMDIYEEIGSPNMSTPDGFVAALKAMQEKYPDRVPYITPGDVWKHAASVFGTQFGMPPYHVREDGVVTDQLYSDEARQAALFANRLAREGLMVKESLIASTNVSAMVFNGEVMAYFWNTREEGKTPDDNPDTYFHAMAPFDTYKSYSTPSVGGWKTIMISKKCEHPDRAIRALEFMMSQEGNRILYWGTEGKSPAEGGAWTGDYINGPHYYLDEDGKPTYYADFWAAKCADWDGTAVKSGLKEIAYGEDSYLSNVVTWMKDDPISRMEAEYYSGKSEYAPWFAIRIPAGTELADIDASVDVIKSDYVAKIVFAQTEEDALKAYDEMLVKMEKAGQAKLDEFFTATYTELKEQYSK